MARGACVRPWVFVFVAALLAACGPAAGSTTAAPVVPPATTAAPLPTAVPSQPPEPTDTAGPTPLPEASPTARQGLEATDPTTVVLAAGQPTFVEFFAFW